MSLRHPLKLRPDVAVQGYNLLLWLYPPHFRRAYGDDMRLLFRDCLRDARQGDNTKVLDLWLSTLLDIWLSVPRAHLEEWTSMSTTYTRSSQIGAFAAFAAALLFLSVFAVGDTDAAFGIQLTGILIALLFVLLFVVTVALYRRVQAVSASPLARVGIGTALASVLLGTGAGLVWALNLNLDNLWYILMLALALMMLAFSLLGLSVINLPTLGRWRYAPLLPFGFVLMAMLLVFFYQETATVNQLLSLITLFLALLGIFGTGVLLWTKAK